MQLCGLIFVCLLFVPYPFVTLLSLFIFISLETQNTEDEDDYDEAPATMMGGDKAELQTVLKTLSAKLEDLQTCSDLIAKQCAALQRSLAEAEAVAADNPQEVMTKMKAVNERATLFRITSSAMVNVSCLALSFKIHSMMQ